MGQGGQRGALTWRTLASASEKGAHFPVDRDRAGEHHLPPHEKRDSRRGDWWLLLTAALHREWASCCSLSAANTPFTFALGFCVIIIFPDACSRANFTMCILLIVPSFSKHVMDYWMKNDYQLSYVEEGGRWEGKKHNWLFSISQFFSGPSFYIERIISLALKIVMFCFFTFFLLNLAIWLQNEFHLLFWPFHHL